MGGSHRRPLVFWRFEEGVLSLDISWRFLVLFLEFLQSWTFWESHYHVTPNSSGFDSTFSLECVFQKSWFLDFEFKFHHSLANVIFSTSTTTPDMRFVSIFVALIEVPNDINAWTINFKKYLICAFGNLFDVLGCYERFCWGVIRKTMNKILWKCAKITKNLPRSRVGRSQMTNHVISKGIWFQDIHVGQAPEFFNAILNDSGHSNETPMHKK